MTRTTIASLLTLTLSGIAVAQEAAAPVPRSDVEIQSTPSSPTPQLSQTDLETWLDGVLPYTMKRGDIAGAVVVVVKNGRVLLAKGYGFADVAKRTPVDPDRTLFRPGSISKLFTWTAVMQLAEQGKLDLDRDINVYLDFKIPPRDDGPITLRDLLTHTPGFDDKIKSLIVSDPKRMEPLGDAVRPPPKRVYPAGSTPAYSNYGAGLAGYIVQRVSGQPFDRYLEEHIFGLLGMTHSTFRQPLPESLREEMSKGYQLASQDPKPYEFIPLAPAGGMATTGADMAKFMILHLQEGRVGSVQLLKPETARLMHRKVDAAPLNKTALGFGTATINGHRVIAHSGATLLFLSNMDLYIDDGVGLFVALNSAGKGAVSGELFSALFEGFADRYLPGTTPAPERGIDKGTAKAHARMIVGLYEASRRSVSTFLAAPGLFGQAEVSANEDGSIILSGAVAPNGEPVRWREVAPFVWRGDRGEQQLEALVKDGTVVRFAVGPANVFDPVSWWRSSAWLVPALVAALIALLLTVVLRPVAALIRRHYGASLGLVAQQARAHRLTRLAALAVLATLLTWAGTIVGMSSNNALLSPRLDGWIWTLNIVGLLVFAMVPAIALWNAILVWRAPHRWFVRLWSAVLVAACLVVLWFAIVAKLLAFSVNY